MERCFIRRENLERVQIMHVKGSKSVFTFFIKVNFKTDSKNVKVDFF